MDKPTIVITYDRSKLGPQTPEDFLRLPEVQKRKHKGKPKQPKWDTGIRWDIINHFIDESSLRFQNWHNQLYHQNQNVRIETEKLYNQLKEMLEEGMYSIIYQYGLNHHAKQDGRLIYRVITSKRIKSTISKILIIYNKLCAEMELPTRDCIEMRDRFVKKYTKRMPGSSNIRIIIPKRVPSRLAKLRNFQKQLDKAKKRGLENTLNGEAANTPRITKNERKLVDRTFIESPEAKEIRLLRQECRYLGSSLDDSYYQFPKSVAFYIDQYFEEFENIIQTLNITIPLSNITLDKRFLTDTDHKNRQLYYVSLPPCMEWGESEQY